MTARASDFDRALRTALRYVDYAARTASEVARRLARDGYGAEIVASVVRELQERGWLDDRKFAQDWVRDRAERKGYGRARLAAELRRKGVAGDILDAATSSLDADDELARARPVARARWDSLCGKCAGPRDVMRLKARLGDFLYRRGFAWEVIKQVLSELPPNP